MPAKTGSHRALAAKYNCSHEFIRKLKAEGLDCRRKRRSRPAGEGARARRSPRLSASLPGEGVQAAVARLQSAEEALHGDYIAALAANSATASQRLKEWTGVVEQLSKIENDATGIKRDKASVLGKTELAEVFGTLFSNLRLDLESLARRVAPELEGKTKLEIEPTIEAETNRIIDRAERYIRLTKEQSNVAGRYSLRRAPLLSAALSRRCQQEDSADCPNEERANRDNSVLLEYPSLVGREMGLPALASSPPKSLATVPERNLHSALEPTEPVNAY